MKKELGVLMVLSVVLLSGCGSDKPTALPQGSGESPSKQVTTQPVHGTDEKLLGSSEDEKVKFYKQTDGVTLDINGNKKTFLGMSLVILELPRRYFIRMLQAMEKKRL